MRHMHDKVKWTSWLVHQGPTLRRNKIRGHGAARVVIDDEHAMGGGMPSPSFGARDRWALLEDAEHAFMAFQSL